MASKNKTFRVKVSQLRTSEFDDGPSDADPFITGLSQGEMLAVAETYRQVDQGNEERSLAVWEQWYSTARQKATQLFPWITDEEYYLALQERLLGEGNGHNFTDKKEIRKERAVVHAIGRIRRIALHPTLFWDSAKLGKALDHLEDSFSGYNPRVFSRRESRKVNGILRESYLLLEQTLEGENQEIVGIVRKHFTDFFCGFLTKYFPGVVIPASQNGHHAASSLEWTVEVASAAPRNGHPAPSYVLPAYTPPNGHHRPLVRTGRASKVVSVPAPVIRSSVDSIGLRY